MLEKNRYTGKTKEEAINNAKIDLQELEEDLYRMKKILDAYDRENLIEDDDEEEDY